MNRMSQTKKRIENPIVISALIFHRSLSYAIASKLGMIYKGCSLFFSYSDLVCLLCAYWCAMDTGSFKASEFGKMYCHVKDYKFSTKTIYKRIERLEKLKLVRKMYTGDKIFRHKKFRIELTNQGHAFINSIDQYLLEQAIILKSKIYEEPKRKYNATGKRNNLD